MAAVMTMAGSVECGPLAPGSHGGSVQISSAEKLQVNGASVLVESSINGRSVSGCGTPTDTSGDKTCLVVTGLSSAPATKLKSGGNPVVIEPIRGGTDGTIGGAPQQTLTGSAGQSKLTAI